MILHQLDDDPDVVAVVLDGDDPHDVGGVLSVWVLAILVGQKKTSVGLFQLKWTLAILGNQLLAKRSCTILGQKLCEKKDYFNLSPL